MPHVWSPIMASAIRAAGARYVTIAHDADTHPGDYRTKIAKRLLDWAAMSSDQVLTLSAAVTERLLMNSHIPPDKITTLFHPDLTYGPPLLRRPPTPGHPMRLLFMGRILPYKGLSLFLDTVETLRAQGHAVEIGVFGEGALGANKSRLAKLQAEIVNRWLSEAEIAQVLPRFHCMVLSHTEASQSGVAAMALGFGLPVVATPVGGLREQIRDGETGVLAARVDAPALATAIRSLLLDPVRYEMTCHAIARARGQRSMAEFIRQCADSVRV
jgi:glycosyltransferase involved in cell wall biosynthesis